MHTSGRTQSIILLYFIKLNNFNIIISLGYETYFLQFSAYFIPYWNLLTYRKAYKYTHTRLLLKDEHRNEQ